MFWIREILWIYLEHIDCEARALSIIVKTMKLFIFGSCVTRDIFDYADKNDWVGKYYSRQSIVSAASSPIALAKEKINLTLPWQKEAVQRDDERVSLCGINKSQRQNEELEFYYSHLIDAAGGSLTVMPKITAVTNPNHKWGFTPMHCTREYYLSIFVS